MTLDGYLLPAFLLSTLGTILFLYGKRAPNLIAGIAGIALIIEPCILFTPWQLWTAGTLTTTLYLTLTYARRGLASE